jgi:hypothetical protein
MGRAVFGDVETISKAACHYKKWPEVNAAVRATL